MKNQLEKAVFAIILSVGIMFGLHSCCTGGSVEASGKGYQYIEQTVNETVVELTEQITEIYPICPELIQALIFYESSNQSDIISKYGDIGYMQVNPKWQSDRMDKLGVSNLYDGYSNILVGTDYLYDMCVEHEDVAVALMAYNMGSDKAVELAEAGVISDYARKILDLSHELEILHGK